MTVPERIATWRKFKDKSGFPHAAFPLETERLILRPLEDEDAVPLATTSNDERVSKNLARLPFPYTLADAEAFIAKVKAERQQKPDVVLAVIRKVDQAFIGVASIEEERLGYGLGHAFWGQGYGTEAITALVNFWFSILQMPKLRASALVTNVASQRILEKLGFVQTGTKECSSLAYEGTKPGFLYELFQEDFLKRGEAA